MEGMTVWASAQKLIGETSTLTEGGGAVVKPVEKPSEATDCFQNADELPSSGGRKIC